MFYLIITLECFKNLAYFHMWGAIVEESAESEVAYYNHVVDKNREIEIHQP